MAGSTNRLSKFVVDASVILSIILPDEKISKRYEGYLKLWGEAKYVCKAPALLKYEVANSLKSSFVQKRLSKALTQKLYDQFLSMEIEYEELKFKDALKLAIFNNLSFYDASYLYLAKTNRCKLLTLDTKLSGVLQ